MRCLIICQTGKTVGLGHLSRCRVIADRLHDDGYKIQILVQSDKAVNVTHDRFNLQQTSFHRDILKTIKTTVRNFQPNIIIFDLQQKKIPAGFEVLLTQLHQGSVKLVGIDTMDKYRNQLDLLFKPSIHFNDIAADPSASPVLWGWDCYLLKCSHPKVRWQPGNRVLVLTGGSDITNLGRTYPEKLDRLLPADTELHWVCGPFAENPNLPVSPRINFVVHKAPDSLDTIMSSSNYAITIYGVSFYELLYYGIPTVVFSPYGTKDQKHLDIIQSEKVALTAQDEKDALGKLSLLMNNPITAIKLSALASTKVSGCGAQRLSKAITDLFNNSNRQLQHA